MSEHLMIGLAVYGALGVFWLAGTLIARSEEGYRQLFSRLALATPVWPLILAILCVYYGVRGLGGLIEDAFPGNKPDYAKIEAIETQIELEDRLLEQQRVNARLREEIKAREYEERLTKRRKKAWR
jgi:hypothetical protein